MTPIKYTDRELWLSPTKAWGQYGSGTENSPLPAAGEAFNRTLDQIGENCTIHLLPGLYMSPGISVRNGWRLIGAPGYQSQIRFYNAAGFSTPGTKSTLILSEGPAGRNSADVFNVEIAGLVLDCNAYVFNTGECSVGAVALHGANIWIHHNRVIHWGMNTGNLAMENFVIAAGAAWYNGSRSPGIVIEHNQVMWGANLERRFPGPQPNALITVSGAIGSYAISPIIRDNLIIGDPGPKNRCVGITVTGCVNAQVVDNSIYNCEIGGPWADSWHNVSMRIRGNFYHDCQNGVYLLAGGNAWKEGEAVRVAHFDRVEVLDNIFELSPVPEARGCIFACADWQNGPALFQQVLLDGNVYRWSDPKHTQPLDVYAAVFHRCREVTINDQVSDLFAVRTTNKCLYVAKFEPPEGMRLQNYMPNVWSEDRQDYMY